MRLSSGSRLTNYLVLDIAVTLLHMQQEKDGYISPKADKRALAPIINNTDLCVYVRSNGD